MSVVVCKADGRSPWMRDIPLQPEDAEMVQRAWDRCLADQRAGPETETAERAAGDIEDRLLIDPSLGLGLRIRLRGLIEFVRVCTRQGTTETAATGRETVGQDLLGKTKASVRKYISLGQNKTVPKEKFENTLILAIDQAIARVAKSHRDTDFDVPKIDSGVVRQLVMKRAYRGEAAYLDYFRDLRQLLISDRKIDGTLLRSRSKSNPSGFLQTPERTQQVDRLIRMIRSSEINYSAVIPVFAIGMPPALTELARHTIDRLANQGEGPDVLYLPASPHVADGRNIDYATLLTWLDAFLHPRLYEYGGGTELQLSDVMVEYATYEIRKKLDRVRRTLQSRPLILLVDGVDQASSMQPELLAAVTGAPVLRLIKQLSYVDADGLGSLRSPQDSGLGKTRIVVFVSALNDLQEFSTITRNVPIKISPPNQEGFDELANQFQNPTAVSKEISTGEWRQDALLIADALATLRECPPAEAQAADLFSALKQKDERWALYLAFLALTDDGLRQSRLTRFVTMWERFTGSNSLGDQVAVEAALQSLRSKLPGLISEAALENIPGLDDQADIDGDLELVATASPGSDMCLFISDAALKQQLKTHLSLVTATSDTFTDKQRGLMHWILAEEAIRQHTISVRHTHWQDRESLDFHRRLLQALKHGFEAVASDFNSDWLRPHIHRVLPSAREELFVRLWAIYYRDLTEAAPKFRLSRVLQADHVKRDLLRLARTAFIKCFGTNFESYSGSIGLASKVVSSIAGDLAVASARAAYDSDYPGEAVELAHDEDQAPLTTSLEVAVGRQYTDWRTIVHARPPGAGYIKANLSLLKIQVDSLIYDGREASMKDARLLVEDWLKQDSTFTPNVESEPSSEAPPSLRKLLSDVTGDLWKELGECEANLDVGVRTLARTLKGLQRTTMRQKTEENERRTWTEPLAAKINALAEKGALGGAADMILRLAELDAKEVFNSASRRRVEVGRLLRAYLLGRLSETMRRILFLTNPRSASSKVSGQPTGSFVQICFELHQLRQLSQSKKDGPSLAWAPEQFFLTEARRTIDELSRFNGSLPRERWAILTLEAELIQHKRGSNWQRSLHLLNQADRHLVEGGPNLRARLAMLFERITVCARALGAGTLAHYVKPDLSATQRRYLVELLSYDRERFSLQYGAFATAPVQWRSARATIESYWQDISRGPTFQS